MRQEDDSTKSASVVSRETSLSMDSGKNIATKFRSEPETGFKSNEMDGCSDLSTTTAYNANHAQSSSGNPPFSNDQKGIYVSKYSFLSDGNYSPLFPV